MKLPSLFPKPIKWDDVRDEILNAIEDEERINTPAVIPNTETAIMTTGQESQTENTQVLVTATTA
jgi:hypothetical protein